MITLILASSLCLSGAYERSAPPTQDELVEAGADVQRLPVVFVFDRCAFMRKWGAVRGVAGNNTIILPDDWRLDPEILAHEVAHIARGHGECAALRVEHERALRTEAYALARRLERVAAHVADCDL